MYCSLKLLTGVSEYYWPAVLMSPEAAVTPPWRSLFSSVVFKNNLALVAIDEAHCILDWLDIIYPCG